MEKSKKLSSPIYVEGEISWLYQLCFPSFTLLNCFFFFPDKAFPSLSTTTRSATISHFSTCRSMPYTIFGSKNESSKHQSTTLNRSSEEIIVFQNSHPSSIGLNLIYSAFQKRKVQKSPFPINPFFPTSVSFTAERPSPSNKSNK